MNDLRGEFKFTINKKKYDAVVSLNALRLMCQAHKMELGELDNFLKNDPMTAICALAYWGVKNAAMRKDKESNLPSFDVFCAWALDDNDTFEQLSTAVLSTFGDPNEAAGNE